MTTGDIVWLVIAYTAMALLFLVVGVASANSDKEADMRKTGALVALLSPVWPVIILILLWECVAWLVHVARTGEKPS